ncbi:MAG: asparagine synthase (glutamine-hydrolyzing) [Magnetospirillum sp.]|jgi:asparagine synthase (glutamine-hydrolysing)|nr:asparagine synthase (glutamine-hydrolyzing) [Magnetospirillum sp.]
MCGIAGAFAYGANAPALREAELRAMRDAMALRGPDGTGEYFSIDGRLALGHRRLAIVDLRSVADQPMRLAGSGLHIVFNGEIFNYQALRDELTAQGAVFETASDTEVLLHLYARDGVAMLGRLRGMFAFAIHDAAKGEMFLARDAFGIKPLYIADDGGTLRFASQVKALLASDRVDRRPNPAGHAGFFLWGHVPDPHTLYRGISALPAGHFAIVDARGMRKPAPFFDLCAALSARGAPAMDLRAAVVDTVRHHMIADVPVGVFLSAGIDSTVLAGIAAETNASQLDTVTLGFDTFRGSANDETALAEEFAAARGTRQHTVWIDRAHFSAARDALFAAMDQPTVDGINTYFVAEAAKQVGLKVALSGLGGDEIFAGYPSFAQIPKLVRQAAPFGFMGPAVRLATQDWIGRIASPKYAGLLEYGGTFEGAYLLRRALYMPWEIAKLLPRGMAEEGLAELGYPDTLDRGLGAASSDRLKVSALEIANYMRDRLLRDSDWAGMAHSVEIRVPFVDPVFLANALPHLAHAGKRDLAATPKPPLPDALRDRPKTGFVVPVREWLVGAGDRHGHLRGLRGWANHVYSTFVDA